MNSLKIRILILLLVIPTLVAAQEIELFQQFNGKYDYLAFGNTLNIGENTGDGTPCEILPESSAEYNLEPDQTLVAAYLYWAGSGTGDFEVTLNGNTINAERTFSYELDIGHVYFAAYADITSLVETIGNGTYTLSDLVPDISIGFYCGNTTNFGGWSVTIIYEDDDLPLNQVNVFDGMEGVFFFNPSIEIELTNLNVLDNTGAKIGFLAWEGDKNLAIGETLSINGNILSNPPLNPENNAFNSTNSFTGSDVMYNMDMDFYDIENNIQPGDETATIRLTSFQDLVMVNNIITVLNNELPDATIVIDNIVGGTECGNRDITMDYTVFNVNSTDELPAGTSIGFFANNSLLGQAETQSELPIGGSESGSIQLSIPENIPADFLLRAFVDHLALVPEINEENNEDNIEFHLLVLPEIVGLFDLELCDVEGTETFDLTQVTTQIDPDNTITFHITEADANSGDNPIVDPENYENTINPQEIWVRVDNSDCFAVDSFQIEVVNCPLPDATITIDNEIFACRQRDLLIEFTARNTEGTAPLPGGTIISFYADLVLIGQAQTLAAIPEGGSETGSLEITLSEDLPNNFELLGAIDDIGDGSGVVQELNEFNNEFTVQAEFGTILPIANLPGLEECDLGFNTALFDLTEQNDRISTNSGDEITYFTSMEDAITNQNPIADPEQFENQTDPQIIYVRLENEICFVTSFFLITTDNCKPVIPEGISPNGDGLNDVFKITTIVDVFDDFILKIYSREGNLIYEGGNEEGLWNAIPNRGILRQNKVVPVGTYFYVLLLNDPEFPDPFLGAVYVNY